ncbi:MAG TPA: hypothetical protein VG102_03285 [Candidatus Paceibacterota bacterium]|jgi:hypothetical protein|nr:hypothetical protein [Candidatus Paceibacterota bacterium]
MKKLFQDIFKASTIGLLFQGTVVNFQPLSGSNSNLAGPLSQFFSSSNLPGLFNAAFSMALSAGAILAVLRLAYAGWLYMSSDAFGTKSHAKEVIQNAILGLLLLIGIYIILNQINPCLLNLNVVQTISGGTGQCGGSSAASSPAVQSITGASSGL